MTDEPQKPKRRRRWLVVLVVLFVVSVAGWWYWPRGDARFVGKWSVAQKMGQGIKGTMTLYRHGRGVTEASGSSKRLSYPWQVQGDRLFMGTPSTAITRFANAAYSMVSPAPAPPLILEQEILDFEFTNDPSTILLHAKGMTLILTRIPE